MHKFVSQATPQNKAVTRDQDSKPENKTALTRNNQNDHASLTIQFKNKKASQPKISKKQIQKNIFIFFFKMVFFILFSSRILIV